MLWAVKLLGRENHSKEKKKKTTKRACSASDFSVYLMAFNNQHQLAPKFNKSSAQQLVFGCPRSSKHGSELVWQHCCFVGCRVMSLMLSPAIIWPKDQSQTQTDQQCQWSEAAPGWHSLCQQPAHLQWSHWHLLQNKYCLGFSIIYPPWPAMMQQQWHRYNFELCISSFPQPHRTSKRTWVIYLNVNIHWYFRKPQLSIQGTCMRLTGMMKDLWKTSVFQSDRWETGRVLQPSSYRTGCLFLGNSMTWEAAHSWSHLNMGAERCPCVWVPLQSVEPCHWRQDCYSGTRSRCLFQKNLSGVLWVHWHWSWEAAEIPSSHLSTHAQRPVHSVMIRCCTWCAESHAKVLSFQAQSSDVTVYRKPNLLQQRKQVSFF